MGHLCKRGDLEEALEVAEASQEKDRGPIGSRHCFRTRYVLRMTTSGGTTVGPTKKQLAALAIARVFAVLVYVAFSVFFLYLYFDAVQMATQAGAPKLKEVLLDCDLGPDTTLLQCAVDHVSKTANLATGMVGITAGAVPAILFARERWELISAALAILSGFIGMISIVVTEAQTPQLVAVVGLLVISLLFSTVAPAVLRLKERVVRKDELNDSQQSSDQVERTRLLGEFETRVKQQRLIQMVPNWLIVLGVPIIAAMVFAVLFVANV